MFYGDGPVDKKIEGIFDQNNDQEFELLLQEKFSCYKELFTLLPSLSPLVFVSLTLEYLRGNLYKELQMELGEKMRIKK